MSGVVFFGAKKLASRNPCCDWHPVVFEWHYIQDIILMAKSVASVLVPSTWYLWQGCKERVVLKVQLTPLCNDV